MQSPENVECKWEGNAAPIFQPQCIYDRAQGHLVILTSPQGPAPADQQPLCVGLADLANISANVSYQLNFTLLNPPSEAILPLHYQGEMLIDDEHSVPFVPGAVSTPEGTILGVVQSPNALSIVNASTCVDLGDATCEGRTQFPTGCSLGHKLHDCAVQSDEQVLVAVIGCLTECNQSSGVIGDDHRALRSACCGLKCLDSCWTRRLAVQPLDLHTTCISPAGGRLPVVNVSLWRMHPGGSGGVYVGPRDGGASVVPDVAGEIDFTEGTVINARVVPGAGEGCSVETPWLCTNSLVLSPSAPYLNSSGASLPVDLQSGVAIFTDLVLQNAPPGPYQIAFFASNLDRAAFHGRVGRLEAPKFLATSTWPIGILRVRHTTDLCQCPANWYMSFNASIKKETCAECPALSSSPAGSSSRTQCACVLGYVDHQNADFPVTELVEIMEIPYVEEVEYVHRLNCSNINECYDSFLGESKHNCDIHAQCHDTAGSFFCLCEPGYHGNGTACRECPAATFQSEAGRDNCSACPANSTSLPASTSITMCGCDPGNGISVQAQACVTCERGQYSEGGSMGCAQCEQGKFSDATGVSACQSCPNQTVSAPGSALVTDCFCVPGYSGNSISGCSQCNPGTFKGINGTHECALCAASEYSVETGATACISCPINTVSDPGSANISDCVCESGFEGAHWACSPCLPGTFKADAGTELCAGCQEGTYSDVYGADVCATCPINSLSPASSANLSDCACTPGYQQGSVTQEACFPCPLGHFKGVNMSNCSLCPPGLYGPVEGLDACLECARGNYSSSSGQTECHQCGAGKYLDVTGARAESECELCGAGTYSTAVGAESEAACLPCGRGKYSTGRGIDNEDKCTLCGAGLFSEQVGASDGTVCEACAVGKYSPASGNSAATDCTPCGRGKYSLASGAVNASFCLPCAAGKYLDTPGSSACTECPQGTYSTTANATDISYCRPCSAGTYQQGTGVSAAGDCQLCAAGTFSQQLGAIDPGTCESCGTGTYANASGTITCRPCPRGRFGASLGLTACEACVAGQFQAVEGSTSCDECAEGKYSNTVGLTYDGCKPCETAKYMAATGAVECDPCPGSEEGKTSSPPGSTDVSQCGCSPGYSPYVNGVRIPFDDADPCRACPSGTYKAHAGADACLNCSMNSGSETASAFCDCDAGFAGSHGTLDAECSSDLPSAPFCTVTTVLPQGDLSSMSLSIDVVETDFSSVSEYITFIYVGNDAIASNLLLTGGKDALPQACSSFTRVLDAVTVPEAAIESSGDNRFLRFRMETTAQVGGNSVCSGKTLYARLRLRFHCQACLKGDYKSARGPGECQTCDADSFSNQLRASTECVACPDLSSAPPSSFSYDNCTCNEGLVGPPCSECGEGNYKGLVQGFYVCTECPGCDRGRYRHDCIHRSEGVCLDCPLGFFKPTSSPEERNTLPCMPCPAGKFGKSSQAYLLRGTNECANCDAGFYSAGGASSCTGCAAGKYSPTSQGPSESVCIACDPGYYSPTVAAVSSATCMPCPAGSHSNTAGLGAESGCLLCAPGKYSELAGQTAETACQPCGAGKYSGVAGVSDAADCLLCPEGMFSPMAVAVGESASDVCQLCPVGTFNDNAGASICVLCRVGTYNGEAGATSRDFCLNCTAGTYGAYESQDELEDCIKCPPGKFSKVEGAAMDVCLFCPAGTYSQYAGWGTDCLECDRGKYSTFSGQTTRSTCVPCGVGKYSTYRGSPSSANCLLCEAGKYSPDVWATTCRDCMYFPVNRATSPLGSDSESDCQCLRGYESDTCTPCAAGKYKNRLGSSQCFMCDSGTYSAQSAATVCQVCPTDATSPRGSTSLDACICKPGFTFPDDSPTCTPCEQGKYKPTEGTEPCQDCSPAGSGFTTAPGADSADLCLCPVGKILTGGTCTACTAGKYSSILSRNSACLDCPNGAESLSGAGNCECQANQALQGYHGFSQGVCSDDKDGAPACVLRLPLPPDSDYFITIDVTQTDFAAVSESVSKVHVGGVASCELKMIK